MKKNTLLKYTLAAVLGFAGAANADVIFSEDFSDGMADDRWDDTDSTPATVEDWVGTGGASARGLATTYDHDENGGTPNIDILGGLEVMDANGAVPITTEAFATFILPTTVDVSIDAMLRFFATQRLTGGSGGNGPKTVKVTNTTDSRVILDDDAVSFNNSAWVVNNYALTFIADDLGDTIELRFGETISGGGSAGARGLEIADISIDASITIPEPGTAALLGLGLIGLTFVRRR